MALEAAAAGLSLGPDDVAVHDAVMLIERYPADPFAAGAVAPRLADIAAACDVGVRVYCKTGGMNEGDGGEGSSDGQEGRRGVEDVYILAGGIGDTVMRFVEQCMATEGLVEGNSLQVVHRRWWYPMRDAKKGGGHDTENTPQRHRLQEPPYAAGVYTTPEELEKLVTSECDLDWQNVLFQANMMRALANLGKNAVPRGAKKDGKKKKGGLGGIEKSGKKTKKKMVFGDVPEDKKKPKKKGPWGDL